MATSMMEGLHNNVSTFADNGIPYSLYNANIPSSSSVPGQNVFPFLTTVNSLGQQMDESNNF